MRASLLTTVDIFFPGPTECNLSRRILASAVPCREYEGIFGGRVALFDPLPFCYEMCLSCHRMELILNPVGPCSYRSHIFATGRKLRALRISAAQLQL